MEIKRVLNNNSVVTLDEYNNEIIVTGISIGYKKKKGDIIDEAVIDKKYKLENNEISRRFQDVLKTVSDKYLIVTDKIIDAIKTEYNIKVSDALYITLTDHIDSVIDRYEAGIVLENTMLWDIKNLYRNEFAIGKKAIEWIEDLSGIELDENEAGFIAMHIVMAEVNSDMQNISNITHLINSILQIVQDYYKIEYRKESTHYQRFVTHLKFFAIRILEGTHVDDDMSELYDMYASQNQAVLHGVEKIGDFLKEQHQYSLNKDEKLHLMMHVNRILKQ